VGSLRFPRHQDVTMMNAFVKGCLTLTPGLTIYSASGKRRRPVRRENASKVCSRIAWRKPMDTSRSFYFQSTNQSIGKEPVLLLSAEDLKKRLTPEIGFAALNAAYKALAQDPDSEPKTLGFKVDDGSFHIKAGVYPKSRHFFAAKLNANFPGNHRHNLPTIQGLVVLVEGAKGVPLAVMDSGELTAIRTAAANALAASHGARPNSRVATIIGCGFQSGYVLEAFQNVLPLKQVFAYDRDTKRAKAFAGAYHGKGGVMVEAVQDFTAATGSSDVIITCTTSKSPVLMKDHVRPGTFIAAVGADNAEKQELDPELFRDAAILVDDLEKCALEAELHHALAAGVTTKENVRADLCQLASGQVKGRETDDEIVIFDSLGTGLQDVALAWAAYEASA